MKVLSVIPKSYEKDGQTKTLYNVALEKDGKQIGATSWAEVKVGDEIAEDRLHPGKKEGEWVIWSDKKGGKTWQRNDDLIVAQCSMKLVIDLLIAGKISIPISGKVLAEQCLIVAKAIKDTSTALASSTSLKPEATVSMIEAKTSAQHQIKNMGELRKAIADSYPTCRTVAQQDSILGKEPITDFDAAFKKVVEYMEREI
jgi:hypothetical protein